MADILTSPIPLVFHREEDDTWWVESPTVPAAHTNGRTIESATSRMREALALVLECDESDLPELTPVAFDTGDPMLDRLIAAERTIRDRATSMVEVAQALTLQVLDSIPESIKISLRDLGSILGVSHGRVQQLLAELEEHEADEEFKARIRSIAERSAELLDA